MIYLVQPKRNGSVSGGFRFNREVSRRLEEEGTGCAIGLDELEGEGVAASDTVVVDSLYLTRDVPGFVRSIGGGRCLLLHYLPSLRPELDEASARGLAAREREWFDWTDRIVAPSYRFAARLRRIVPDRVELHVATPAVGPQFRRAIARGRHVAEADRVRLVTVGALTKSKDVGAILSSLTACDPRSFVWDIAGDLDREPAYRRGFTSELERSGLKESVRLWHCLDPPSVARLLDRSHLFVTASREESFGMATAEAAARGVAVLGYDVGCASKWITPEVNGVLFSVRQRAEFERELVALIVDRPRLASLSDGARALSTRLSFASWDDTFREFRLALASSAELRRVASPERRLARQ